MDDTRPGPLGRGARCRSHGDPGLVHDELKSLEARKRDLESQMLAAKAAASAKTASKSAKKAAKKTAAAERKAAKNDSER